MLAMMGRLMQPDSGTITIRGNDVAMVLAQDTDYVLLDEPLNNLDMQHSVQMMKPSATYSTPPFRCLITAADYSPAIFNL
jgi:ABC superfamily ATP binding cassette transporter, ABC protein